MTAEDIILRVGQSCLAMSDTRLAQQQNAAFLALDATGALAVAWEWLVLLALACWIGMLLCEGVALHGVARAQMQTRPLHWLCLAALFVGSVVLLILQAAQLTATPDLAAMGRFLFTSTYGALWLARTGLILLAAGLPLLTRQRRYVAAIARLVLAGLILLTLVYSSTAGAAALAWVSLAAQLAWFGIFYYLASILLPLLRGIDPERHAETLIAVLRRLYPLLSSVAGVLLISTLCRPAFFPGTVARFVSSLPGQVELVQWLLVVMMLAASSYVLFALCPRVARQAALEQTTCALTRASLLSAGFGALVLLCSALLAFMIAPNPTSLPGTNSLATPAVAPSPTAGSAIMQSKRAGSLSITLEVTPARVELANTVLVTLTDARSDKPVGNGQITVTTSMQAMNMGTTRITMSGGKPEYRAMFPADSAFSMFGLWNITLLIRQPGHAPVQVVFTVLFND